jgi:hypothetical protein
MIVVEPLQEYRAGGCEDLSVGMGITTTQRTISAHLRIYSFSKLPRLDDALPSKYPSEARSVYTSLDFRTLQELMH